ncbi:NAC domain-containing protein 100 [Citrus sinensis]|nr:NAC domain-containing protein 100 [Citrus sinensis]
MDSLVGFRFHPTDEEIILLLTLKRFDPGFSVRTIKEIDLYSFEPWELPWHSEIQSEEEVWYFFCEPYYKYAKSKRAHRRTKEGYWKKTGNGSKIKRKYSTEVIGTKKILSFLRDDTAAKKAKTEWVIHEIAVEDSPDYEGGGYNGLSDASFPALRPPVYSEKESSCANGSSYGSGLLNSQFDGEQVDSQFNSQRDFQNEYSSDETGQTTPDFFSSDEGVFLEDSSEPSPSMNYIDTAVKSSKFCGDVSVVEAEAMELGVHSAGVQA